MIMQTFEHYPNLTDHILRMASTGQTGTEWSSFLGELNAVLLGLENKWIIAEENPPPNYEEVLCWVEHKQYMKVLIYIDGKFEDEDRVEIPVSFYRKLPIPPNQ